jgi:hypothetical protein
MGKFYLALWLMSPQIGKLQLLHTMKLWVYNLELANLWAHAHFAVNPNFCCQTQ